jgi:hypothetical protein
LGQIDREADGVAVTLQPPGAPSGQEVADAVTNLLRRLERRFPALGIILRFDPSRRKSGDNEGTVTCHVHAVAYGVPVSSLRVALRRHWGGVWGVSADAVEAGTYCEAVENFDRWSSYIARERDSDLSRALGEIGRRWTIRGRAHLPWSWTLTVRVPPEAVTRVRRWFESVARTRVHSLLSADPLQWIRAAGLARDGPPERVQRENRRPSPEVLPTVFGETITREQLRTYRAAWRREGINYQFREQTTAAR